MWERALNFESTRLIHFEGLGSVYLFVLTSGLHVPISLMRMSQNVFLGQDRSFANCDVLKLTLCVCVVSL